jgi:hypothetical protein
MGCVILPAIQRAHAFSYRGGWFRYHLLPNTACSGRVGTHRVFWAFSGLEFIPFRRRVSAHPPSAANAKPLGGLGFFLFLFLGKMI